MTSSFDSLGLMGVTCLTCMGLVACGGQEQTGTSSGDNATIADEYVTAHNLVRSSVAQPGNYPGTWAPLPPVVWSASVAASAQAWADHLKTSANCGLDHDDANDLGENIAGGTIGFGATNAVNMWADEKSGYVFDPVYAFDSDTGHYTQIVWRTSTQIGCGISQCSSGYRVFVCRYSPAGNVIGAQPY